MKFLSKLGQILIKGTQIVTGLGPLFPQYSNQIVHTIDTLQKVSEIVINVEAFGAVLNTPGADKLRAASPLVAQAILQSDMLVKKKIKDSALFKAGIDKITSGMADVLNSVDDNIDTADVVN